MINVYNFYTFSRFDISNINNQQPIDFTTQKNKKTAWNQRKHTGNTSYVRPGEKLPEAKWKVATNVDLYRFPYLCPTVGLVFGDTSRLIKMEVLEV